jgi:hypothetical protein
MKMPRILLGWVGMLVSLGIASAAEVNLLARSDENENRNVFTVPVDLLGRR